MFIEFASLEGCAKRGAHTEVKTGMVVIEW
jgi:hypothetical protein